MKIRNSFVSNSSSASFILRVNNTNLEELCQEIFNVNEFSYFWFDNELLKKLDKRIEDLKKLINEDDSHRVLPNFKEFWINDLKEYENLRELILNEECELDKKVIETLRMMYRIKINSITDNSFEIVNGVVMFNDYDDIHPILKNYALYCVERKKSIEFSIDDDTGEIF